MGSAGAGAADEDGVALGVEERAGGQFAHLALIDRRVGEDEAVQVFQDREPGAADAIADRSRLTVGPLGPDQSGDEGIDLVAPGERSEEHTSELQSLMRISYAVFCLKKKILNKYDRRE